MNATERGMRAFQEAGGEEEWKSAPVVGRWSEGRELARGNLIRDCHIYAPRSLGSV